MGLIMKKNIVLTMLLLIIVLTMTGCTNEKKVTENPGEVKIYYLDAKGLKLLSKNYQPQTTTKEDKVRELLQVLSKAPEDVLYKNALPPDSIEDVQFNDNDKLSILSIYFNTSYNDLDKVEETLCRATIVKTLTQISGVDGIEFYVNEKPLLNSNGDKVGLLYEKDFIENPDDETNYKVSLYFSNKSGRKLIEYQTTFTGNDIIEEWVIQHLINGPIESSMKNTIPEGTTLLNISTKEGICTVDFNENFLEKIQGVDDKVMIYSVVNTLVSIPNRNISKVQFLINGEVKESYRDIPFDGLFERDLSMNQEGE
jgi:germination protein M